MSVDLPPQAKVAIKRGLAGAYRAAARPSAGCRALLYHSIGSGPQAQPLAGFEEQMRYLRDVADFAEPGELRRMTPSDRPRVLLTFDDGYRNTFELATPVLQKLGIRAVFFVVTGLLEGNYSPARAPQFGLYEDTPLMDWHHVRALHDAGMEIGSHSKFHADFSRCGHIRLRNEVVDSVRAIREHLGKDKVMFAYPFGQKAQLTATSRATLRAAGVDLAFSTLWGPVTERSDPLALPRIRIDPDDTLADFRAKLSGAWDFIRWVHGPPPRS